ncbi:MAG: RsmB/NOP family class I SAM-dependent RNA methyltransferase [Rhodobacteraceae bacterium]|nr:RsmB/NOP family class I SAM-dependent RNA methyltransferase [Paracoccaceae bacterium]
MTPAARIQAAIECLDEILAGQPAEQCLTRWARGHRFAGSKDRAEIRDHVYSALRQRSSLAWIGGAMTGRGLMIGMLRQSGIDPQTVFSGEGYAPAPLSAQECKPPPPIEDAPWSVQHDVPTWMEKDVRADLAPRAEAICDAFRQRAQVFLRVATARGSVDDAINALGAAGITASRHEQVETSLVVTDGARRIKQSMPYLTGLVELQDVSGNAAVRALKNKYKPLRILDLCAGGGGKSLALADAFPSAKIVASDANFSRMRDLPDRARRARVDIEIRASDALNSETDRFDLVLCDVPCSGSGTWRRQPDAKWRFSSDELQRLTDLQADILRRARDFVSPGGTLAYMTCSFLTRENDTQITGFRTENPDWRFAMSRRFDTIKGGDIFFLATLTR